MNTVYRFCIILVTAIVGTLAHASIRETGGSPTFENVVRKIAPLGTAVLPACEAALIARNYERSMAGVPRDNALNVKWSDDSNWQGELIYTDPQTGKIIRIQIDGGATQPEFRIFIKSVNVIDPDAGEGK
jgi:hypothetical protein